MRLVDLETAKTLQELGYDGEYAKSYTDFGNPTIDITTSLLYPTEIPAPRLDDVAYFLRDRYGVNISVSTDACADRKTECYAYRLDTWDEDEGWWWTDVYAAELDYDSALEAAVNKAIEIIKNKQ